MHGSEDRLHDKPAWLAAGPCVIIATLSPCHHMIIVACGRLRCLLVYAAGCYGADFFRQQPECRHKHRLRLEYFVPITPP